MGDRPDHEWNTSKTRHMAIEEEGSRFTSMAPVVDPMEAERLIESLVKFPVEEIGSSRWMDQHRVIEKLNIQAHQNAMTNSDEYVLEAILTFQKLDLLFDDLISIEAWKEHVYPRILSTVAGRNNMRVYFILYHEATLVNLLEVLLYHKHVAGVGGEKLIEIVDYVARKLARLNSGYDFSEYTPVAGASAKDIAAHIESRTPADELAQHLTEIEFRVCISACSIVRFICEHADVLNLSVLSRITDTHDVLILLIPLIENPPWTRRTAAGKWQKLIDQRWTEVPPIDLLKITKLEGQPWLGLYHLVAKKEFRERYHLNSFRKGQLLRVRKYLNEILLDQLPVLADVQRYMDELSLMDVPEPPMMSNSVFMMQQVAVTRESILKGKNWDEVAAHQLKSIFTMTDKDDADIRKIADLYSDDLLEDVLEPWPPEAAHAQSTAGAPNEV